MGLGMRKYSVHPEWIQEKQTDPFPKKMLLEFHYYRRIPFMGNKRFDNFCSGMASDSSGRQLISPHGSILQPADYNQMDYDFRDGRYYNISGFKHCAPAAKTKMVPALALSFILCAVGVDAYYPYYFWRFSRARSADTPDARREISAGILGHAEAAASSE